MRQKIRSATPSTCEGYQNHGLDISNISVTLDYMPTIKQRINLTVPRDVGQALERLAHRDDISVSSKTLDLVRRALELEEDIVLQEVAEKRDRKGVRFVSHKSAWR